MKIWMIRHGETPGNREKRYVGSTDEGLTEEEVNRLTEWRKKEKILLNENGRITETDFSGLLTGSAAIYRSPMKRCLDTYKEMTGDLAIRLPEPLVYENLRECDFGDFEYKNYLELNGTKAYQRFLDTMGESGFPHGETMEEYKERTVAAFRTIVNMEMKKEEKNDLLLFFVHGGTIMAVMSSLSDEGRDYYDYQCKNLCGYLAEVAEGEDERILLTKLVKTELL